MAGRFQPVSSLHEEESKRIATSFQNEVAKWSSKWETFFQVYITDDDKEDMIGFDRTLQNQQPLPSRRFLRKNIYLDKKCLGGDLDIWTMSYVQIEGPLVYGTVDINSNVEKLYVANVLTQKWKRLPPRPNAYQNYVHCVKLVVETTSPAYKLIFFSLARGGVHNYSVQIYDSKSGTWSRELQFTVGCSEMPYTSAYLKGILYVFTRHKSRSTGKNLLAFNLEERTLTRLSLSGAIHVEGKGLVVCNDTLVLIAIDLESFSVFKVDLGTSTMSEVARCPRSGFKLIPRNVFEMGAIIDGQMLDCFCFQIGNSNNLLVVYNQRKDEWVVFSFPDTHLGWRPISFQPGLNTFMAV